MARNQKSPHIPAFLSLTAVAEKLDKSVRSVQRLIAKGELAAHKFGGAVRISEDELARYIAHSMHGGGRQDE